MDECNAHKHEQGKHLGLSSENQAQTEKGRVHRMSLIRATDGSCRRQQGKQGCTRSGGERGDGGTSEIVNITTNANTFMKTWSCSGRATWHHFTFVPHTAVPSLTSSCDGTMWSKCTATWKKGSTAAEDSLENQDWAISDKK